MKKRKLKLSKKKILELPFRLIAGMRTVPNVFSNMLVFQYRRPFELSNKNKSWEKVEEMPLKKLMEYGQKWMSIIVSGKLSPYWKKFTDKDKWIANPMTKEEASYFRMILRKIQCACREHGFTEKDGRFMSLDISSL